MAPYLSAAWFDEVRPSADRLTADPELVLRQVVTGTPDGEVVYDVVVTGGCAGITRPRVEPPDVTLTSDYTTAAAIVSGELSAHSALVQGRIRIGGNLARLNQRQASLAGLDPLPASVRAATTF